MAFRLSDDTQRLTLGQPFVLESGEVLPEVEVAYRTWGTLSPAADNAVVVCHALTGSADADDWWAPFFGLGKALDETQQFIVCSNVLGGCYGTTGPTSLASDGQPWGGRFPHVTIRDQVRLQMLLADHLGIRRIQSVIGGSMGGLQALEWAVMDSQRVSSVVTVAASARHSPWCMAWSETQRLALASDPAFQGGHYDLGQPPVQGLSLARAIAMVSYRSPESLDERFGCCASESGGGSDQPRVQDWLHHHGKALVARFDANSYLRLINAMDTHDLGRGRGGCRKVLQSIRQPVLVGSVVSDALYTPAEQRHLAGQLHHASLFSIGSPHGHDGFLMDCAQYEPRIRRFLQQEVLASVPRPFRLSGRQPVQTQSFERVVISN